MLQCHDQRVTQVMKSRGPEPAASTLLADRLTHSSLTQHDQICVNCLMVFGLALFYGVLTALINTDFYSKPAG